MPDSVRRIARKSHRCSGCDRNAITPGQPYLSGTVFPGHDLIPTTVPLRLAECALCGDKPTREELSAEVDRLRAENDSIFADLLQYSQLHWEDCLLDAEDCYLCEGYERIRANAADPKAAQ